MPEKMVWLFRVGKPKNGIVAMINEISDGLDGGEKIDVGYIGYKETVRETVARVGCVALMRVNGHSVSMSAGFPDRKSGECHLSAATTRNERGQGYFRQTFEALESVCNENENCTMKMLVAQTRSNTIGRTCLFNGFTGEYDDELKVSVYTKKRGK
jgi:hypothetical protein